MTKETFQSTVAGSLPHAPGIYKYYSRDKKLLYVGKAKDLRKRISSYFVKEQDNRKTQKLVEQIDSIEWTVTHNEHDAFLLENSLIKHFKPHYNISLKDDKSYPYVVIRKEHFPRIYLTRRKIRDGSEYLGPFTSVYAVRELLQIIKENIPLRTCNLKLTPESIAKGKFKVCLEYHLGNCGGPCQGFQSEADYQKNVQDIKHILKGHLGPIIQDLKASMKMLAEQMKYEEAHHIKQRLEAILNYENKSTIVGNDKLNTDVATVILEDNVAYVNYMVVIEGKMLHSKSIQVERKLDEKADAILAYLLAYLRPRFQSPNQEVITPFPIETEEEQLKCVVPLAGDKKKLLDMSFKNSEHFKRESKQKAALLLRNKTDEDWLNILEQLQQDLQLTELPDHIECFDNSNFQGAFPVAAMVCFKNGKPSKKDYRHFHIKTVEGINDFASMAEIVHRRYKRLLEEKAELPKLVIIDGGKGQLGAAMSSIEALGLTGRMTLVGLAKREESIFFPGDKDPIQLPYNGSSLLLIRRIRDEVHRFGITFHRDTRSKGTIKNELESIPGIGTTTAQTLLQTYRSVNKVKQMTLRELTMTIGAAKARKVYAYFHPEE